MEQLSKLSLGDKKIQSNNCTMVLYVQKQPWDEDLYPRQSQIGGFIFMLPYLMSSCNLLKNFNFSLMQLSGDSNQGELVNS